jgi:GNAT superfamily N-acetyltransferase
MPTVVLMEVQAWYRARGLPPCLQLTDAAAPVGLEAALAARGYARVTPTSVMLADASTVAGVPAVAVSLYETAGAEVLDTLADPSWSATVRREREALCSRIPAPHRFALILLDGEPAAGGLCVVDGALGAIFSMRTQPRFRRRGLARATLLALADWAREAGAAWLFLQVEDDNPVQELYRASGFTRRHGYHYRELVSHP